MTLLLDTNALIWWLTDDKRLGRRTRRDIASGQSHVYVSDVVFLELAIKLRTGKLRAEIDFRAVEDRLSADAIRQVAFDGWSAQQFIDTPQLSWADPFDVAHISLAIAKRMVLVTTDRKILEARVGTLRTQDAKL